MPVVSQTFLGALALAGVHVFAGKLRFLHVTPRSIWLSMAAGVSVSYVFLHILPELASAQEEFRASTANWIVRLERHVWLLSLAGLSGFYGLERMVLQARSGPDAGAAQEGEPSGLFWLHITSFALYNVLFGYLLSRRETGGQELTFYAIAIGLHFLVNDFGLQLDHRSWYGGTARWILAAAILSGWGLGLAFDIHHIGTSALFAFLAGGIVLNVLKEELPEERRSRFGAFAAGALIYSALLLGAA